MGAGRGEQWDIGGECAIFESGVETLGYGVEGEDMGYGWQGAG